MSPGRGISCLLAVSQGDFTGNCRYCTVIALWYVSYCTKHTDTHAYKCVHMISSTILLLECSEMRMWIFWKYLNHQGCQIHAAVLPGNFLNDNSSSNWLVNLILVSMAMFSMTRSLMDTFGKVSSHQGCQIYVQGCQISSILHKLEYNWLINMILISISMFWMIMDWMEIFLKHLDHQGC